MSNPPPDAPTLGTTRHEPESGCVGASDEGFGAVNNKAAPDARSAPPAMKPTVETVASVVPDE